MVPYPYPAFFWSMPVLIFADVTCPDFEKRLSKSLSVVTEEMLPTYILLGICVKNKKLFKNKEVNNFLDLVRSIPLIEDYLKSFR